MSDESDWRLMGQEHYLTGAMLVRRQYRRPQRNPNWNHDHCEFCWAKFMDEDFPNVLREGYCTEDEYRWICEQCFTDFREQFGWSINQNI